MDCIPNPYSLADNFHDIIGNLSIVRKALLIKASKAGRTSRQGVQIPKLNFRLCLRQLPPVFTLVDHLLKGNLNGNIFRYLNRKYAPIQPLLICKFCEGLVLPGSKLCICLSRREKEQMT